MNKKNIINILLALSISFPLSSADLVKDERSGIPITWRIEKNMFPETWYTSPVNAEVTPVYEGKKTDRIIKVIKSALAKYPGQLLKNNIRKIYVVDNLKFYGVEYCGTGSPFAIYITNKCFISDEFIELTFHHEFLHLLKAKYETNFDKAAWISCNPEEFSYGDGGVDAIKKGEASLEFSDEENRNGFLCQYSRSDIDEDVAIMAENLFLPRTGFFEALEKYPRLRKKSRIVMQFYKSLDPVFTEEYFTKLHNTLKKQKLSL